VTRTRLIGGAVAICAVLASAAAAAPEQVTITARPSIVRWGTPVTLIGSVANGRAEEVVTIEANDCGPSSQTFRGVASTRTEDGGRWSFQYSPLVNTTLRAVWRDDASAPITVQQRPSVLLRQLAASRFSVAAWGKGGASFWRKRILFQRFDRRLGTWATVKQVVLTESSGYTTFRARVPKAGLVRAVIPRSQTRPCYLAGYSPLLRT
jgi:hypothetical protein